MLSFHFSGIMSWCAFSKQHSDCMDLTNIYFVCKCLCLSVYVCTTCSPSEPVEAIRGSDPLEPELQALVSCSVGARSLARGFCKASEGFYLLSCLCSFCMKVLEGSWSLSEWCALCCNSRGTRFPPILNNDVSIFFKKNLNSLTGTLLLFESVFPGR